VAAAPGALAQKKMRERKNHRYGGDHTGLPCAVVLRLIGALLGEPMLVCHRRFREASRLRSNLSPASGRQDHAISPYEVDAGRRRPIPVHRIPHHAHDDRDTPLTPARNGMEESTVFGKTKDIYFARGGLERVKRFDAACKIRFVVREIFAHCASATGVAAITLAANERALRLSAFRRPAKCATRIGLSLQDHAR
jgi:hypothetical protein